MYASTLSSVTMQICKLLSCLGIFKLGLCSGDKFGWCRLHGRWWSRCPLHVQSD